MPFISSVKIKSNSKQRTSLLEAGNDSSTYIHATNVSENSSYGTYKHKRIFQNECSIYDQVCHEGVRTTSLTVKKP